MKVGYKKELFEKSSINNYYKSKYNKQKERNNKNKP